MRAPAARSATAIVATLAGILPFIAVSIRRKAPGPDGPGASDPPRNVKGRAADSEMEQTSVSAHADCAHAQAIHSTPIPLAPHPTSDGTRPFPRCQPPPSPAGHGVT